MIPGVILSIGIIVPITGGETVRLTILSVVCLLLAACATGPDFSVDNGNKGLQPDQVAAQPELANGDKVIWGGKIASSNNLADETHLEIIAYPLSSNQSPQTNKPTQGRFMVISEGYLEPIDYAVGREVTVTGALNKTLAGQIGDANYNYPVIEPEELYLWPRESTGGGIPIRFGIGVIFSN